MKKTIRILVLLFFLSGNIFAQLNAEEQIIVKAMKDQMKNSMDSLKLKNFPRPSFIQYTYKKGEISRISYNRGSLYEELIQEPSDLVRTDMVVRDEKGQTNLNLRSKGFSIYPMGNSSRVPVYADYDEVRRVCWLLDDGLYKGAIKDYESKIRRRAEPSLPDNVKKAIDLPDFTTMTSTVHYDPFAVNPVDADYWHKLLAEVTGIYRQYEGLYDVGATVDFSCANIYVVNTEGSEMRHASLDATVAVHIRVKNDDKQYFGETLSFIGLTAQDLPSKEEILRQTREAIELVLELSKSEQIDKEYLGPALIDAPVVVDNYMFSNFTASRTNAYSYGNVSDNIGLRLGASSLSMKSTPLLKEFKGKKLMGNYAVDADGVKPEAEFVLMEKGVLKRQFNDRTPTESAPAPTGHLLFDTYVRSVGKALMPGILQVNCSETQSAEGLKAELIRRAKEDGLDYAFLIKRLENGSTRWFYKVSVEDGSEKLVRGCQFNVDGKRGLRRVVGASDEMNVYFLKQNGRSNSVIAPSEFLFEEVSVNK